MGHHISIAISISDGSAVAIVGLSENYRSFGISIEHMSMINKELDRGWLMRLEKGLLSTIPAAHRDEWSLRAWLAIEAVAKASMNSMRWGSSFPTIVSLRTETGEVDMAVGDDSDEKLSDHAGEVITAQTGRINDFVFAVSLL